MRRPIKRPNVRIMTVAVLGLVLGVGLFSGHTGSRAVATPASAANPDGPAVILNWYAPSSRADDAAITNPLADGALFIAPALFGSCSAQPPCFDRAGVLDELVRVGGGQGCYQMTNIEIAGNYVTGQIHVADEVEAFAGCR